MARKAERKALIRIRARKSRKRNKGPGTGSLTERRIATQPNSPARADYEAAPGPVSRRASRERAFTHRALREHGGNVSETCAALGVPRKTFYEKMQKHGLRRRDHLGS